MQILVMGGTRFVGKPLVARLMAQGHALTLFTRGKNHVPAGVEHITGDRSSDEGLSALQGRGFDVICLLYTSPSPRDRQKSRMPSSA